MLADWFVSNVCWSGVCIVFLYGVFREGFVSRAGTRAWA